MSVFHDSIHYVGDELHIDSVPASAIVEQVGTPTYVYSLKRVVANIQHIRQAFRSFDAHIHYSAKANNNLAVLRAVINQRVGVDCVSAGEIYKALKAGIQPEQIVFAGVGKTLEEIRYALEQRIGWLNIENVDECRIVNTLVEDLKLQPMQVALRANPEIIAETHPYIATGHGGAKFGLTADTIENLLANQANFPHLRFAGIHLHIGSQLGNTTATEQAVEAVLDVIRPYRSIHTVNIGGGLPIPYRQDEALPDYAAFANLLYPLLKDYRLLLEPGRSIVGDAGILLTRILYIKQQAGHTFYIVDASMSELIRPALYQAHHEIRPIHRLADEKPSPVMVVGPVCETTDVLGREIQLPQLKSGDVLAIMTSGAYGMVMASNYNARPHAPEVVINEDGHGWHIARRRGSFDDLLLQEIH